MSVMIGICTGVVTLARAEETGSRGLPQNPVEALRCTFVYGAILEAADELGRADVSYFARKRVSWIGGYMSLCRTTPSCAAGLEGHLDDLRRFKEHALDVKAHLLSGMRSQQPTVFNAAIDEARGCDSSLGIEARDIPSFAPPSPNTAANDQPSTVGVFCLSDQELDQVLVPIFLRKMGAMAGTCLRKYPAKRELALEAMRAFETTYSAQDREAAQTGKRILQSHGISEAGQESILKQAEGKAISLA